MPKRRFPAHCVLVIPIFPSSPLFAGIYLPCESELPLSVLCIFFFCTVGLKKAKEVDMEGFLCIFCTRRYCADIHNDGESMIFYYFRLPASNILF